MVETPDPPKTKYRYILVIEGNSHEEIEDELHSASRGGYVLDSDYHSRDTFDVIGGRKHSTLELVNEDMTPERYERELDEWRRARKAARREATDV